MKIGKPKIQDRWTIVLMVVGALVWMLSPAPVATGTYADSAHGNVSYGVNRPGTDCPTGTPCPTGDCTHCHDAFDSSVCGVNEHMLFYDNIITVCDGVCYECHKQGATEQEVYNYAYGYKFGGFSTPYYPFVYTHFCHYFSQYSTYCGSRHWLGSIHNTIKDNGYGWGYGSDPTPCEACHNTHLAQRIGATQYHPPYDPSRSPITRPSERYNNPSNPLWGDDASERMDQYAASVDGHYQAPYYGDISDANWELSYEPSGTASPSDGSNLPDYVTFCMDCHQYTQYDPERSGQTVKAIEWGPPWCTSYVNDHPNRATYDRRNGASKSYPKSDLGRG